MPDDPLALDYLHSLQAIAIALGSSEKQLRLLLYGRPTNRRYVPFKIPKRRGGQRQIDAPRSDLKSLQRRLAAILATVYVPRSSVHGFVRERSIATNASPHQRMRHVLNVDLNNFFPSINFGRVRGLLMAPPLNIPAEGATILAQLCCHEGALPQGAPTSPILSNMICMRLDRHLVELARKHKCTCTRYVDDITFSKRKHGFPPELAYIDASGNVCIGQDLRTAVESNGFQIHADKIHLFTNQHRQTVTGLTVNTKTNVPRVFRRQIRAMIHDWLMHGEESASTKHATLFYRRKGKAGGIPAISAIIRGKIEYIKMVRGIRDPVYRNLQSQFVRVCPDYLSVMQEENSRMQQRDVFISHASEDKATIAKPLADALIRVGFTVWYDEYEILVGDSIREKIDEGLIKSRFGIVILSPSFFALKKKWTRRELDGLLAVEDNQPGKKILPILHELTHEELVKRSPILAGVKAIVAKDRTFAEMISDLTPVLRPR